MAGRAALALLALCVAAPSAAATTPLPGFHSPSGNIRCFAVSGRGAPETLRCELRHADYAARLQARCMRPDGSGVDWHGFELGRRSAGAVTCSGGILYDVGRQRPVFRDLPYAAIWRHGAFTCASRRSGVTCRNAAGHGLFLSRQSWRAW